MFAVTEADAAAIRTAFDEGGELSAVVEFRRLFPGIASSVDVRLCVRTIAGWQPIPIPAAPQPTTRLRHRSGH